MPASSPETYLNKLGCRPYFVGTDSHRLCGRIRNHTALPEAWSETPPEGRFPASDHSGQSLASAGTSMRTLSERKMNL